MRWGHLRFYQRTNGVIRFAAGGQQQSNRSRPETDGVSHYHIQHQRLPDRHVGMENGKGSGDGSADLAGYQVGQKHGRLSSSC